MVKKLALVVLMTFVVSCSAILGLTDPRIDENAAASDAMPDTMMTSGDALLTGDGAQGDAGPCGDTMTSGTDCGRCGHSCLGGACALGQCQPIVLATMQQRPLQLAVSNDSVYWTNTVSNQIMKANKAVGGDAAVFALGPDVDNPWGITVDATTVYWANYADNFSGGGGIRSCPLTGCPVGGPTMLASAYQAIDVVVDARNIYFTVNSPHSVLQANKVDGGGVVDFSTGADSPFHVAVGPDAFYWTSNGSNVHGLPIDGGTPIDLGLLNGDYAGGIAVDPTGVYWAVERDTASGSVNKSSFTAGTVLLAFGTTNPDPVNIVLDSKRIYWTNRGTGSNVADVVTNDGSVLSCPLEGCDKGEGLKILGPAQHNALGLAQDNDAIYWTTNPPTGGGMIMKVAKP